MRSKNLYQLIGISAEKLITLALQNEEIISFSVDQGYVIRIMDYDDGMYLWYVRDAYNLGDNGNRNETEMQLHLRIAKERGWA